MVVGNVSGCLVVGGFKLKGGVSDVHSHLILEKRSMLSQMMVGNDAW